MALQAALKRSMAAKSAPCCSGLGANLTANVNFIEHPFYMGRAARRQITQQVPSVSPVSAFLRQLKQAASRGSYGDPYLRTDPPRWLHLRPVAPTVAHR